MALPAMRKFLKRYYFIAMVIVAGCAGNENTIVIRESYAIDSVKQGEAFAGCYYRLRRRLNNDSIVHSLYFPFKATISMGSGDFKEEQYNSLAEFKQSGFFNRFLNDLRVNLQYSYEYKTIYADRYFKGQTLKLVFEKTNTGFRFISINGRWYLTEYAEELAFF